MKSPEPLWELSGVSVNGRKATRLSAVHLRLHLGVTAVIGSSGAGKTTLLNLLAGFESPHQGVISGRPRVAWAPPNGSLWPHLTVQEHMRTANPAKPTTEWMNLLEAFDLAGRLESHPDELSEGEQSRLTVARALVMPANVFVMDEPLVHVDPARAEVCWQIIRLWLTATNASLIFTTHAPEEVLAEAERVVCLKEGRVLWAGNVDDLYWNPPTTELARFLGPNNWLEPAEAFRWLGVQEQIAHCWRPEQIEVKPCASNLGFMVESTRFCGSVADVDLRDPQSGIKRRFYHRPAGRLLYAGQRVLLRAVT